MSLLILVQKLSQTFGACSEVRACRRVICSGTLLQNKSITELDMTIIKATQLCIGSHESSMDDTTTDNLYSPFHRRGEWPQPKGTAMSKSKTCSEVLGCFFVFSNY